MTKWIVLFLLAAYPVFYLWAPHLFKEKQVKQEVLAYLEKSQDWSEDDLLSIKVVNDWMSNGIPWRYRVTVVRKKEPETQYEFYSEENGQVKLFSIPSQNGVLLLERANNFNH